MSIERVLPDEEWTRLETTGEVRFPIRGGARRTPIGDLAIWNRGTVEVPREAIPALIAVAFAMLPHDHRLKITRAHVASLRRIAQDVANEAGAPGVPPDEDLTHVADLLESLLPSADVAFDELT